ncbi:MAG: response regulator [Candidatus Obscuribacterales bacterium]|nr:response regulator [Candidatus Obscuribacterales bacterium]
MNNDSGKKVKSFLEQVQRLRRNLDAKPLLSSEQRRSLKLIHYGFKRAKKESKQDLRLLPEALRQLKPRIQPSFAVFSERGELSYYSDNLKNILETEPCREVFFQIENRPAAEQTATNELPWLQSQKDEELFAARILYEHKPSQMRKWLSCLQSKLHPAVKEKKSNNYFAACLQDLSEEAQMEVSLASICFAMENEVSNLDSLSQQLEQLNQSLEKQGFWQESEEEFSAPRTGERPPCEFEDSDTTSRKVLIVDDLPVNRKILSLRLKKLNLESDFAQNGPEAIEKTLSGNYALVFLDCDLPVMDGIETCKHIRQGELSNGRHVPIVGLSSSSKERERERCLSAGMDEYIDKGASQNLLKEVIEWCRQRSRAKDEAGISIDDYEEELDISALNKIYTKEELSELLELFISSTNTLMRCLRMSMDSRDLRSIGHFAYSLKGPLSSLGLQISSKLTARLTDAAEESQWEEADDYYLMLSKNCETVRQQLKERALKS